MNAPTGIHAPRPKFDTLFADPRHYRGDCRLMRTAIRRGWLDDAPQADRDALVARFEQACAERRADDPDHRSVRALLAEVCTVAAMVDADQRDHAHALRTLRYAIGWTPTGQTNGRPRERWHVADYPKGSGFIASACWRQAKASGATKADPGAFVVQLASDPTDAGVRIAFIIDGRGRVLLRCPRCGTARARLYSVRAGVGCRLCLCIRYGDG